MDKQEQEQFKELTRALTGCDDCGDCNECPFHDYCGEREIAEHLWEEGWRKEKKDG